MSEKGLVVPGEVPPGWSAWEFTDTSWETRSPKNDKERVYFTICKVNSENHDKPFQVYRIDEIINVNPDNVKTLSDILNITLMYSSNSLKNVLNYIKESSLQSI